MPFYFLELKLKTLKNFVALYSNLAKTFIMSIKKLYEFKENV